MDISGEKWVEIIIPLSFTSGLTYRLPEEFKVDNPIGRRVLVQMGKNRLYSGLVRKVVEAPPPGFQIKDVLEILDDKPILTEIQFKLWDWIAEYYLCELGDVMNAALPATFKLSSESKVVIEQENQSLYPKDLHPRELQILDALAERKELSLRDISGILGIKSIHKYIQNLIYHELISLYEEVKEKFKPKTEVWLRINEVYCGENNLKLLFENLKRAPAQADALMAFLQLTGSFVGDADAIVNQKELLKKENVKESAIAALIRKGILHKEWIEKGRLEKLGQGQSIDDIKLSVAQQNAIFSIKEAFSENKTVLLHGVTSSGKTEVYAKLINETLQQGKQVLYLLPEIVLTTQLTERIANYFPGKVQVYHSRLNDNERYELWKSVYQGKDGKFPVIIGARSSIFLPFQNLGLVIIDEEHEHSYKQFDPAPRYNARDMAILLGTIHNAQVILGSATPSVESYYKAQSGKYKLVELTERFGNVHLPQVELINLKGYYRNHEMRGNFSPVIEREIKDKLTKKEQVILFQNRRGYSLFLQCKDCGWTPYCKNCDISLSYHQSIGKAKCHYCGYTTLFPEKCGNCGSTNIDQKGFGTEKVEDEVKLFFPNTSVERLDLDTTQGKNSFSRIISDFAEAKTQILVGTQMITKGLDFENVTLVGVLNADNMLHFSDFRAHERTFQLLSQVGGRAGRRDKPGKVLIQTFQPEHHVLQKVKAHDYSGFYEMEIKDRYQFAYPPFTRLIKFTLKHKDFTYCKVQSNVFANFLKQTFGKRVLGPEVPPIARLRNMFQFEILVKFRADENLPKAKKIIKEQLSYSANHPELKSIKIIVDVDPY